MPNLCNYQMKVVGKKENVEEFIKIMQANYDYRAMEFSHDKHMGGRVFEAYVDEFKEVDNNKFAAIICGDCAWSVSSCMFGGEWSYYNGFKNDYQDKCRSTTVPIESKELDLNIEIFSEESGCCFMEHYLVRKGDVEIEDCVDWEEYFIDEYETKEEAEEELGVEFTDEEWENAEDGCVINRGGIEWDYEI